MTTPTSSKSVEPRLSSPGDVEPPGEGEGQLSPQGSNTPAERSKKEESVDYLRQFEIDWESGYPYYLVPSRPYTPPTLGSKRAKMKISLLKQPKIRMIIPRKDGESSKVLQTVNLNGYRLDFPKQAYIDVPEQVANVLAESLAQTEAALKEYLIDREKGVEDALT